MDHLRKQIRQNDLLLPQDIDNYLWQLKERIPPREETIEMNNEFDEHFPTKKEMEARRKYLRAKVMDHPRSSQGCSVAAKSTKHSNNDDSTNTSSDDDEERTCCGMVFDMDWPLKHTENKHHKLSSRNNCVMVFGSNDNYNLGVVSFI